MGARQQEGQQHWPGYRDVCAALEWLLTHRPATGIAFLFDLYPLWEHYGYLGDGRHWLQVGLRYMPAAELPRAHLLRLAGSLAEKQRDLAVAKQLLSEALQLYEALQHAEGQAATAAAGNFPRPKLFQVLAELFRWLLWLSRKDCGLRAELASG